MNVLGIDYGRSKVGVAFSEGKLSEPYEVSHYKHTNELFRRIKQLVETLKIEKIIIGISEGEMAIESKNFSASLEKELNIPVGLQDETLSSIDAQQLAREAGKKLKTRREMEDAYAAALMLQDYLDRSEH